jgi:hypothetical protein
MRRLICISLAAAALWFVAAAPASANPYMSWGQWTSDPGVPFSQCSDRAGQALGSAGLTSTPYGRFFYGANDVFSVSLICYDLGNRFIVTIIVTQDRGTQPSMTTDQVRDRIQSVIFGAGGSAPPPPTGASPGGSGWDATAVPFRGRNGEHFIFTCEPNGHITSLWGTDIYTDDSRVCSAAVHSGLINTTYGGTVTIEMRPGQDSYVGTTRYGVTSSSYGSWGSSYVFVR